MLLRLGVGWGPADAKLVQELVHSIRSIEVSVADFHDQDLIAPETKGLTPIHPDKII